MGNTAMLQFSTSNSNCQFDSLNIWCQLNRHMHRINVTPLPQIAASKFSQNNQYKSVHSEVTVMEQPVPSIHLHQSVIQRWHSGLAVMHLHKVNGIDHYLNLMLSYTIERTKIPNSSLCSVCSRGLQLLNLYSNIQVMHNETHDWDLDLELKQQSGVNQLMHQLDV